MTKRERVAALVLALIAVVTLVALAIMVEPGQFRAGTGIPREWLAGFRDGFEAPRFTIPPSAWTVATIVFWGIIVFSFILVLTSALSRRAAARQTAVSLVLTVLVFALLLVGGSESVRIPHVEVEPIPAATGEPVGEDQAPVLPADTELPSVDPDSPLARTLAILFGTSLFGLMAWWWWRARPSPPEGSMSAGLRRSASEAIDEIRIGGRLDDVILRCYHEMTGVVSDRKGVARDAWETPREYERDLLRLGLPASAVTQLTRLFERVRYGHYVAKEDDRETAIAALQAIVSACERLILPSDQAEGRPRQ